VSARYVTNPMMELSLRVTTYTRSGGRRQFTISRREQPGVFDVVADAARRPRAAVDVRNVTKKYLRLLLRAESEQIAPTLGHLGEDLPQPRHERLVGEIEPQRRH